jgi:hypothetical protein
VPPAVLSEPPLNVTLLADGIALATPICKAPLLIVVEPVYRLAAPSLTVPAVDDFIRFNPDIIPEIPSFVDPPVVTVTAPSPSVILFPVPRVPVTPPVPFAPPAAVTFVVTVNPPAPTNASVPALPPLPFV